MNFSTPCPRRMRSSVFPPSNGTPSLTCNSGSRRPERLETSWIRGMLSPDARPSVSLFWTARHQWLLPQRMSSWLCRSCTWLGKVWIPLLFVLDAEPERCSRLYVPRAQACPCPGSLRQPPESSSSGVILAATYTPRHAQARCRHDQFRTPYGAPAAAYPRALVFSCVSPLTWVPLNSTSPACPMAGARARMAFLMSSSSTAHPNLENSCWTRSIWPSPQGISRTTGEEASSTSF